MRPAHIHFMVRAPGYETLITHIFVEGDPYLETDAVFGVKESLVNDFGLNHSENDAIQFGVSAPFVDVTFDIVLAPAKAP